MKTIYIPQILSKISKNFQLITKIICSNKQPFKPGGMKLMDHINVGSYYSDPAEALNACDQVSPSKLHSL